MPEDPEHVCIDNGILLNGESWACIEGRVYGPCSAENCYGVCEHEGDCRCDCHKERIDG